MVYERRQAPQQAVDAYKKAVELGVNRVTIYERLAFLLYSLRATRRRATRWRC